MIFHKLIFSLNIEYSYCNIYRIYIARKNTCLSSFLLISHCFVKHSQTHLLITDPLAWKKLTLISIVFNVELIFIWFDPHYQVGGGYNFGKVSNYIDEVNYIDSSWITYYKWFGNHSRWLKLWRTTMYTLYQNLFRTFTTFPTKIDHCSSGCQSLMKSSYQCFTYTSPCWVG